MLNKPNERNFDFVCFGEILWDVLPDGARPGGAPMNVAYHLKKLGHNPAIITRIGDDEKGNQLMSILNEKQISTDYVQVDTNLPTGVVHATPDAHGEMSYDIVSPSAWDHISWNDDLHRIFNENSYLVFGSLICRHDDSKSTLFKLLEVARTKVLDINLRPPHYSKSLLEQLLLKADIAKFNRDELNLVSRWNSEVTSEEDQIRNVQETFNLDRVIVTLGGDGAMMYVNGNLYRHPGYHIIVEDTVGSGDAFLGALMSAVSRANSPEECLSAACAIGALVTSRKGAWPEYDPAEIKFLKQK